MTRRNPGYVSGHPEPDHEQQQPYPPQAGRYGKEGRRTKAEPQEAYGPDLGCQGYAFTVPEPAQIFTEEAVGQKPVVQGPGTAHIASGCKKQEGRGRQDRQDRAENAKTYEQAPSHYEDHSFHPGTGIIQGLHNSQPGCISCLGRAKTSRIFHHDYPTVLQTASSVPGRPVQTLGLLTGQSHHHFGTSLKEMPRAWATPLP